MSGVCVGCARLAKHRSGRYVCSAGRFSDEWCLCQVCKVSQALKRNARLRVLAGPVMNGVCTGRVNIFSLLVSYLPVGVH